MKLKRGEIASALLEADQALQCHLSEDKEWHWRFRVLKAEALARGGSYTESLQLLRPELPESLADGDVAVRRRVVQGVASARLQHPIDAMQFLEKAEALAKAKHPDLLGEVLLAKGAVNFLFGDPTGAAVAYSEALQIGRKQQDPFIEAPALSGLGVVATREEHYDESIDLNQSAVALARSVEAQNTLAPTLGNMGWCYRRLGDFENALVLYRQAEEVSARSGQIGLQLYWLAGLSNVYYEIHDYRSAEGVLTQGLDLARKQGNRRTLIEYLNALSEIALETGRADVADKYFVEASDIEQGGASGPGLDRAGVLASQIIRGRIDQAKRDYAQAEKSFREVIGDSKADTSQRWEAEARLARVFADMGRSANAEAEFRRSLETIENARSSVQAEELRISFLSTANLFYGDFVDFLISQNRAADALQVAELSRARTLAEGLGTARKGLSFPLRGFHPQETARRSKAIFLFYWLGQKNSYLWVIAPQKTSLLTLPKASEIEPIVQSYWKSLPDVKDAHDSNASDGKKLYAMLVEPATKLIPHGSKVIVLPSESLYGLNFETLIVPNPQPHFWIEDVTLTTGSSLTMLAASAAQPPPKDKSLFLVGDTKPPNPPFAPLPQAAEEMKQVKKYFTGTQTRVLEGGSATPSAFLKSNLEQFSYLHFVTHGTASHTRPLESAVILSQEGDSYKLYARDIVQHRINASLVTISACNGSGTRAYSGEGLVGLSWAFLRAGAHNVIGALWEVSDASTPQLMDALYSELSQGKDPATALRDAKLALLHSADPDSVFKKPFYWAPFQLYAGS
jgi:CHAT domain-containing protein